MIYEKAAHQRTRGNDASSLDALRNFWRCALLGNMCWQLAHTRRAAPVTLQDIADVGPPKPPGTKGDKKAGGKTAGPASTNAVVAVSPKGDTSTNAVLQHAAGYRRRAAARAARAHQRRRLHAAGTRSRAHTGPYSNAGAAASRR